MKLSVGRIVVPLVGVALTMIALVAWQNVFANSNNPGTITSAQYTHSATPNASTLTVTGTTNCTTKQPMGVAFFIPDLDPSDVPPGGVDIPDSDTITANGNTDVEVLDVVTGTSTPNIHPGIFPLGNALYSPGVASYGTSCSGPVPYTVTLSSSVGRLDTRPLQICNTEYHIKSINLPARSPKGTLNTTPDGTFRNTDNSVETNGFVYGPGACFTIPQSALTPAKTADAPVVDAGTDIGFRISVRNPANGVATASTIHDALPGGNGINWFIESQGAVANGTCAITGTNPNQVLDCGPMNDAPANQNTAVFVVHVQSHTDLDSSKVTAGGACPTPPVHYDNSATVSSSNQDNPVTSNTASVQVNCLATTLDKDVAAASDVQITANYTYVETNNGNVALHDVAVSDNQCSPVVSPDTGDLAAGATRTFTCSHTYTLSSNPQDFTNIATATGTTPLNHIVTDCGTSAAGGRICDSNETSSTTIHVAITVGTRP